MQTRLRERVDQRRRAGASWRGCGQLHRKIRRVQDEQRREACGAGREILTVLPTMPVNSAPTCLDCSSRLSQGHVRIEEHHRRRPFGVEPPQVVR
jgi:hypothetical protein